MEISRRTMNFGIDLVPLGVLFGILLLTTLTISDDTHGFNNGKKSNPCIRTTLANLIMSSLFQMQGLKHDNFIADARKAAKSSNTYVCMGKTLQLEGSIHSEMGRLLVPSVARDCPLETFPLNMFLCNVSWPQDLVELFPLLCKSSCSRINTWTKYHKGRGVTEFPEGWRGQLEKGGMKSIRNARSAPSKYGTIEYASHFGQGVSMDVVKGTSLELLDGGYMRGKRQHGVLPKPKRYVKEFMNTNMLSIGNWTHQARCDDDQWPFAVEDGLPFYMTIHCWGPMGFGGTHTVGQMDNTTENGTLFDCTDQVEFKPPNGTFLIGMSNRVNYGQLDFLVAGVFLCSGEQKWTTVKNNSYDTTNGTGEIVMCKTGQIICTLELKMAQFENKSLTTDVRIGCCEAPERLLYSALTLVPLKLLNETSHSMDDSFQYDGDASEYKNKTIPKTDFQEDFFAAPYGGFFNSFSIDHVIDKKGNESGQTLRLFFGYAFFYDMSRKDLTNQNPLLSGLGKPTTYASCENSFISSITIGSCVRRTERVEYIGPPYYDYRSQNEYPELGVVVKCTNGMNVHELSASCVLSPKRVTDELSAHSDNPGVPKFPGKLVNVSYEDTIEFSDNFTIKCPPKHLICGVRKTSPGSTTNKTRLTLLGYNHTFFCCPVMHTATSICGKDGVQLALEPARVTCIAISGADTTCMTKQTYGYTMGREVMNGTTVDMSTEMSFGYSTTDKLEVIASASVTVSEKATVKGGVSGIAEGEAETGVEATVGVMTTAGTESTRTDSTTNKADTGFSFTEAIKTEETTTQETSTQYTIEDGQTALFYDVVRICGETRIKSEDFIRILTPSVKCDAYMTFEYLFGWLTRFGVNYGKQNITFFGFGLEIENNTFTKPLEQSVNWDLISQGVREKFTGSIVLSDEVRLPKGGYDFKRSPAGLWRRATNRIAYNYTFDLVYPNSFRFYRLVGRCGRWRVITNSIWAQRGDFNTYSVFNEPPDKNVDLEAGVNFRLVDAPVY